jgi:hypothetical protein
MESEVSSVGGGTGRRFTLKMEAMRSSETTYNITRCHSPETGMEIIFLLCPAILSKRIFFTFHPMQASIHTLSLMDISTETIHILNFENCAGIIF